MTVPKPALPVSPSPTPNRGDVVVHVFGRTDVGRTREHNEDAFVVVDLTKDNATLQPEVRTHTLGPRGSLFMVADGMGGAAAGEIASAMAVEVVVEELRGGWLRLEPASPEAFARSLKRATAAANARIHAYASNHSEFRGMGTTATIAGLLGDTLYLAQVGDSRAYIVRDGVARQITKDQSLMQKLIEAGELTEEEAAQSERRNIILQALGPEPVIKVDLTHQHIRRGDILVLCSDGLSGQVDKSEIARVVSEQSDPMTACKHLIDRANEAGGPDNITVIIARFDGTGLQSPGDGDEVGHRVYPLPDTGQTTAATPAAELQELARTTPMAPMPDVRGIAKTPTQPMTMPSAAAPAVSPARRSAGKLIAILLLAALVIFGAWYALHTARVIAPRTDSASQR